jgi:opacity protein-like surface antigen
MGYLNNQIVTVDAILTKKGRELLAKNDGSFRITQFSLSDDEIDYTLFNPNNPSGSAYYGQAIEGMPLLEAFSDETQIMKYLLTTLPRGTAKMPIINIGYTNITLKQGASLSITPQTLNYLGGSQTYETSGYNFTIGDVRTMSVFNGVGINTNASTNLNSTTTLGTNVSKTVIGTTLNLTGTTINTLFGSQTQLQTILIVTGRDSGARVTIPITITKVS